MASLRELIKGYISEAVNNSDKSQAAKQVIVKIRGITYVEKQTSIPKADLLGALRIIKASANDSHLELIDAIMAELEASE